MPTGEVWRRANADVGGQDLSLGVPGAAASAARDADRQRPRLLPRAHAEELGRAARPLAVLARGAGALSRAAAGRRRACTPSARTIAPAPPSTGSSTTRTWPPAARSPAPPSCCGPATISASGSPARGLARLVHEPQPAPRVESGHFLAEENPRDTCWPPLHPASSPSQVSRSTGPPMTSTGKALQVAQDHAAGGAAQHRAGARRRRRARARPHPDAGGVRRAGPEAQDHRRHLDRRDLRRRLCLGPVGPADPRPHRGGAEPALRHRPPAALGARPSRSSSSSTSCRCARRC